MLTTNMGLLSPEELERCQALSAIATARNLPVPESVRLALLRHHAATRGLNIAETFHDFVQNSNPTLLYGEHVPKLVDCAQRVVDGEIRNLLVLLPTRYWKSEVFSRLLPAYYLRTFPRRMVGLISYGADLAWELSENARAYFEASHGEFKKDTQAKKRWGTDEGGEMWAGGVGGPSLGRGFHLGIVDDPVDPEQALSHAFQRRFQRFWPQKFLRAREPEASVILVMQRLGVDDPIDFLLRREVGEGTDKAPMHWHVVVMDEIKSGEPLGRWDGPRGLPSTCTIEPDEREEGEILAPSRFNRKQVEEMQRTAGPVTTSSQRQQRPMRPTGDFWKERWFRTYEELPSDAHNGGKDWDTAFTKNERNSATAWVESYRGVGTKREDGVERFPIYIHDIDWEWKEFPDLVTWMLEVGGPHHVEQKATGKSAVQSLAAYDIIAQEVPVDGDKLMRASAVQGAVAEGRIYVRKHVLHTLLYGERQGLLRITAEALQGEGEGLDLNDAFVQALHRHMEIAVKKKKRKVAVF